VCSSFWQHAQMPSTFNDPQAIFSKKNEGYWGGTTIRSVDVIIKNRVGGESRKRSRLNHGPSAD